MLAVNEESFVVPVSTVSVTPAPIADRAVEVSAVARPYKKHVGRPKKYKNPAARTKAWRQRTAEKKPPTTPEPQYPMLTGDPQVDKELIDAYRRKVSELQAEWDRYLDQDRASSLNRGDEHDLFVTGGYDMAKLDKVDSTQKLGGKADVQTQNDYDFGYGLDEKSRENGGAGDDYEPEDTDEDGDM